MKAPVDRRAVDPDRQALREATAPLAWFHEEWLSVDDPARADEIISDFLMDDCVWVPIGQDRSGWTLNDGIRRLALRQLGPDGARSALSRSTHRPDGAVQAALDRLILQDQTPGPTDPAAELQVARWLQGVVDGLPDQAQIERQLARDELMEPMRSLTAAGFYGRSDWLSRLRAHLDDDDGSPLVISGVGGVGKSTLLAKFVIDSTDADEQLRVAYLNFDRGALEPDRPARLLAEIVRQLALQAPEIATRAERLATDLLEQELLDEQSEGYSSREAQTSLYTKLSQQLFESALKILTVGCPSRLLVVLDTFEEVQRQQLTNVNILWDFLRELREGVDNTRIVVSGRALDTDLGDGLDTQAAELTELDDQAAVEMLTSQSDLEITTELAHHVIDVVSRNPLSLRLAIDVLRGSDQDEPLLDLELQEGQVQGQLYRRILLHIEDPVVRRMAHPGLVVRVLTTDVIRHVLANPCHIDVPDQAAAQRLFEGLEREATLVTSDGTRLRHRADVRALMLPSLERDQKPQVKKIHRAAVKYYRQFDDVESRAEELYHRLMLGQTERTLDKYWVDGVFPLLRESIVELPPSGQVYLWAHSDGEVRVDPEVSQVAADQQWARATQSEAKAAVRAGEPEAAIGIVQQRRGSMGESLLPSIEVEALEDLRRFDEALHVLRAARSAALRRRRPGDAVALSHDILRILERMGEFDEAIDEARMLRESLRDGSGESALDFLAASTTYLRLIRRSGGIDSDEYDNGAQEATQVAEALPFRDLTRRSGLLRELLAEIGNRSAKLLEFGIETIGVARGANQRLDEQLDRVDASIEPDEDASEDDYIATRGATAKKVTKYAHQIGLDEELSDAISVSYQDETDELYS